MTETVIASELGVQPRTLVRPDSPGELARELERARAGGLKVLPVGMGTRLGAGAPPARVDVALSTTGLARIVHYEPADLMVTVEAGSPVLAIGCALRERGQFLPLQPARGRGTIGGLLAAAPEGALDLGYGRIRDRLTGVRIALSDGTVVRSGGRVVKNVAGYGLHRLIVGSFGTLGVIVEASFRVQPLPETTGTRLFAFASKQDAFEAARLALASGTEPVFVNVLLEGDDARLVVGYDGSEGRVASHLAVVATVVAPARPVGNRILSPGEDAEFRQALDDPENHGAEDAADTGTLQPLRCVVRVLALPTRLEEATDRASNAALGQGAEVRVDARPGLGSAFVTISCEGGAGMIRAAASLLTAAREHGHAVIVSAPAEVRSAVDPWGPAPADFFLMKRVKDALDPEGVFVPGRFVGGL